MFLLPLLFAARSFIAQIPVKLLVAVVVLVLGLAALWVGYGHYKDLNSQLVLTRQQLSVAKVEIAAANATIDELKRREAIQAQAFTELERRRMAISSERQELLAQLDEINGDCHELTLPPGALDPDLDRINSVNRGANRMLRGK